MSLLNKKAPAFSLKDQNEESHSLKQYAGQYVLLYFYPKDMTPGCTIEGIQFRDHLEEFKKLNCVILGVSADSCARHKKFEAKENLTFSLLSDPDKNTIGKYGVLKEKSMFGKKYMGISRESFLISPEGKVVKHYEKVKPLEHAKEVLKDLKELSRN